MKDACGSDGTVILSDDFIMGTYTSQIVFSGLKLVIIGNSQTLDAGTSVWSSSGLSRRFFYGSGSGSSLEVRNVTMTKGIEKGAGGWGGAIRVGDKARVEIHDSTFQRNTASNGGGAICIMGGTVVIHDSTFDVNKALWWAGYGGGAIYVSGGAKVEIHGSTFQRNTADSYGGAIYIGDGTLVVRDSTFDTNSVP
jgi:predicted outer membrane repeat protein